MACFVLTDWHKNNPNCWVALKSGAGKQKPVLYDRDVSLVKLAERMGDRKVVYARAWGMGISRNYPTTKI